MSPSRSRKSSSRRSSILKLPKHRQDLQNLNDNNSSNDNSPANTLKFKRRVSFAEKKHVKEFCNSVEQGTVWDSTYEEHDLSNLKMPDTSNQEEHNVHIVHKENIVYFNQENNIQFVSNVNDNGTKSRDMLLSQPEISVHYNNLNATSTQDIHMEFTEVVSHTVYRDVNYIQNNQLVETLQNSSMELTQPIYSSINTLQNFQQEHDIQRLNSQPKLNNLNVTAVDSNASMEFTVAVSSIIKPVDDANKENVSIYSENNRTRRFDNVTMEITTPVPSVPVVLHRLQEPLDNIPMEITAPVPSIIKPVDDANKENVSIYSENNRTRRFDNVSMEITTPVPSVPVVLHRLQEPLDNIPMEITAPVPSIIKPVDDANKENVSIYSENNRTRRFDNVSMEITTPVPSVPVVLHRLQEPLDNIPMEITAPVPSVSSVLHSLQQTVTNNEIGTCDSVIPVGNKVTIFHDNSMEMTSAVKTQANRDTNCQFDEGNISTVTEEAGFKYDNEKTKVLSMSMEVTEAMNMHSIAKSQERKERNRQITDASIENDLRKVRSYLDCCEASTNPDKTSMYDNEVMEFTEAIRTSSKKIPDKTSLTADKTNMYDNEAMEFTEAVRTSPKKMHNKIFLNADKTNMYDNEAMEFTEAIRTSPKNNLTNTEHVQNSQWSNDDEDNSVNLVTNKTTICQNNSMTITNIVLPSSMKDDFKNVTEDHESNINNPELIKTVEYPNMSMDITEDALVLQCHLSRENSVINSAYVKEPVLLENKDKDSLDSNIVPGNILKDITDIVVPSLSESNLIMDKEMRLADDSLQYLKSIATKTSALIEHENSVSNISDTVLLELKQQDADALTLKENIRRETYVLHSPKFHDPSIVIPEFQSQNTISNPRRTYIIQPLNIDHSCNKENDKTSDNVNNEIKNDSVCYTSNDKTSCTRSSLNNTGNLQNNDDKHLTEEDVMFFNNSLEELHTITPPSFLCLEDSDSDTLVDADVEVNLNSNNIKNSEASEEENILENRCNLENISDIHEESLKTDKVVGVQIGQIDKDCSEVYLSPRSESHESPEQKDMSIELDPFSSLMNKLKVCAESDKIIWEVYHENIERNLFVIGFVSSSLLVVIYLKDNFDALGDELIKEIKIYSRLADDADALISLVHRIIMEKLDAQVLADLCKNCGDIFSILDNISKEVKLAMDFMFDVERIRDINLMEITRDSVSFIAFAKRKDIILRVTVDIKPFHKIESKDISVHCRLGSVREEDVKLLITNIKRDYKFLRRYISDVKDYIYLMEESVNIIL
ncbi:uncharacterized protein LOC117609337 isoform X1 [Osmia lignaria lignaria]|uniref:uncharacterized protein LOC117609337 isoform X1 n=1 Tax=Osmia lignaria lignaria TaxID=1437193 RepID=UPI00402B0E02